MTGGFDGDAPDGRGLDAEAEIAVGEGSPNAFGDTGSKTAAGVGGPSAPRAANEVHPPPSVTSDFPTDAPPLAETIVNPLGVAPELMTPHTGSIFDEQSEITVPSNPVGSQLPQQQRSVAPGEALQLVRFARRSETLMITGVTPHGRRLTFEQRADREGWYVVAGGRRRRPTERELGLVVASITQEMETAMAPQEDREEVRSAYRLAASSDQPGLPGRGIQAYRDLLLDEAEAFLSGQIERLGVVAVEYQAFKRFAIRHSHRIGAAFVRALGERLQMLFGDVRKVHACHKAGKSFRLIVIDRSSEQIREMIGLITTDETRRWIVERVWGAESRTHINEVHFHIGFALARASDKKSPSAVLAQRLNDDAFRAAKLGQLQGHESIQVAKMDYRTTVHRWQRTSEEQLEDLASRVDDGPAEVMAEMNDYLHELVPVDLEGMAVEGDVRALVHAAIARDGFWQGSVAMRIAGERLIHRFLEDSPTPDGENDYVGGFELGDEFYGMLRQGDRFYFAWGDLNSAGATRIRAGLDRLRHAVGWRREDGGGILGHFLRALRGEGDERPFPERAREAAKIIHAELADDPELSVNDAVDIAGCLWNQAGEPITNQDLVEGAQLALVVPDAQRTVTVLERRSKFTLRLDIDGREYVAAFNESFTGPYVRLRLRDAVVSSAICILDIRHSQLQDVLEIVREDNMLSDDTPMNVLGFFRHMADLILAEQIKGPSKIEMALGARYQADRFVQVFTLEEVRDRFPGLFYEAIHHELLVTPATGVNRNLGDLVAHTMLARTRPDEGVV